MTFSLTWLPDVLAAAGLKVAEVPGWRTRGRQEMGPLRGVMCHHTANPHPGNMPSLNLLINGRSDLAGPLCQLGLGRDGTFYVVAAGRANHAGAGAWKGITAGNASFIGIEAEHSGDPAGEPWPEVQLDAYARGVAALLARIGVGAEMCCGHKEYRLPAGTKVDPCFDMGRFRATVTDYLVGKTPPPLIPAADMKQRPTLGRGSRGKPVSDLQTLLGLHPDGIFGAITEAALRAAQRGAGLVADGICGPRSWAVLTGEAPAAPPPMPLAVATHGRTPPAAGVALIKSFESCARKRADGLFEAYPDPGQPNGLPWTIGWGSTGAGIARDSVWTQQQCDDRLTADAQRYLDEVLAAVGPAPTTENQLAALLSFHYNTGAIRTATLTQRHIAGDYAGAAEAFMWWDKSGGRVMAGLQRRRRAEADLYLTP